MMRMPYNTYSNQTILFKELITNNLEEIKTYMTWENYNLNEVVIPVIDLVKDHALMVLSKSYGMFHVEQDILDEIIADVFINFPILLQQLSITRLIDAYGVVKEDTDTVETIRNEILNNEVDQNNISVQENTQTDNTIIDNQQLTTGTIDNRNDISNIQNGKTNIENSSGVESTGTRNVNVSHNMPEQSLTGQNGNFPIDEQGTPILSTSYIQEAQEGFTTSNPINTNELSEQITLNSNTGTNNTTTTNDINVADTGTTLRNLNTNGTDNSESKSKTNGTSSLNEMVTSKMTNKQYAYEIKAFLETSDQVNAFKKWEDKFSWVVGIV